MDGRHIVAVTGIGVVTPYGIGRQALVAGLLEGRCALEPVDGERALLGTRTTLGRVQVPVTVPDPRGMRLSRTDRLAVIAAREAWISAGLPVPPTEDCPVIVASTVAGLSDIEMRAAVDPAAYYRAGGFARLTSYPASHVAEAVGACLGTHGMRLGLSVACASGAMALVHAARLITQGHTAMALAGGSDALSGITLAGFHSLRALDPDPCRPFDRARCGLNLGEGAGMLVLEDLAHARARGVEVLAVLRGWAVTNDAFHPTAPGEDGQWLAQCIARAMERAGVEPDDIGYLNAHGTGTPLNDVAETRAYERAFGRRGTRLPVSSTKSYFGHTLGAAGAVEAAVTILALNARALIPTMRLEDPIETGAVDWIRGSAREADYDYAMSVSAGFGGTNASLVLESGLR